MIPYPRQERLARTMLLYSREEMEKLWEAHVMVFGLGGVGSYAAEALCRAGIGRLTLVDADCVEASNLNRQLPALHSTVGKAKVAVVRERLLDIAPDAAIKAVQAFHLPDDPVPIPQDTTCVVDAIDTVAAKLDLAVTCRERSIPMIACMGMGNRMDPTKICIGDIFETSACPLCRVMRRELRKRAVTALRCVYSTEAAHVPCAEQEQPLQQKKTGRPAPGSLPFVPSVAGLYMAYEVIRSICKQEETSIK